MIQRGLDWPCRSGSSGTRCCLAIVPLDGVEGEVVSTSIFRGSYSLLTHPKSFVRNASPKTHQDTQQLRLRRRGEVAARYLEAIMSQGNALSLNDLVQLINSSSDNTAAAHTLPSTESVLLTLQQRFKSDLPWINLGSTTLLSVNPLRHTGGLDDATAALYASPESLWPTEIDDRARATSSSSSAASAHPYDFAGRIFASLQRSGKSQAIIAK